MARLELRGAVEALDAVRDTLAAPHPGSAPAPVQQAWKIADDWLIANGRVPTTYPPPGEDS
jgi:hypothetical protein